MPVYSIGGEQASTHLRRWMLLAPCAQSRFRNVSKLAEVMRIGSSRSLCSWGWCALSWRSDAKPALLRSLSSTQNDLRYSCLVALRCWRPLVCQGQARVYGPRAPFFPWPHNYNMEAIPCRIERAVFLRSDPLEPCLQQVSC